MRGRQLHLNGFLLTEYLDVEAASPAYCLAAGWFVPGLERLNLAHNRLATLPASISLLASLTSLSVASNAVIALPETLSALTRLRVLDLAHNLLTVLPAGLGLAAALEPPAVQRNPLIAPPSEVLRRRPPAVVPYLRGVHAARRTGRLDWKGLGLMALDTLPVMLPDGDAALLKEVYLDDNFLVAIHPAVLRQMPNLEVSPDACPDAVERTRLA
jgi:Leucine-rich repeat (LRR) protein